MKRIIVMLLFIVVHKMAMAQNVGIGTTTPVARLHVTDSSVLFSANGVVAATPGSPPAEGTGRRMMWYADKAAFRAGYASGNSWDKNNIGIHSFASGRNTTASGENSTAMGDNTTASGAHATAMGNSTTASGGSSTAMGAYTTANGFVSTAIGNNTSTNADYSIAMGNSTSTYGNGSMAMGTNSSATGVYSIAMGYNTLAASNYSTAMGVNATASAVYARAMGNNIDASGDYSTAMGNYVNTFNQTGAFLIGDNSTTTVMNGTAPNNFRARFANGYRLYTSADYSTSCALSPGANAWSTSSDVNTKENFENVNGEDFLQKISGLYLTSWNYKKQNPATFRHYGPMAQDFYAAFGKDKYGTIGNDTTINSADFAGVSFIAIQALEKRTQKIEQLEKENAALKKMLLELKKEVDALAGMKKEN